jgi:PIN domain nuclease of toxin-antitoxin system
VKKANIKLLLDTPVLIWALSEPERIKPKVQNLLIDADNIMVLFKCCFFMGITNKKSLNKISLLTDFISHYKKMDLIFYILITNIF